jgi:hypothetical protein
MSSDSDWMVDRRGWYTQQGRTQTSDVPKPADDGHDSAFDTWGYEAAYPSPLPAPASDRDPKERP